MYSFNMLENEKILKKDLCNLAIEGTILNGAFYLTSERLVFVGYLLDQAHKHFTDLSLVHIDEIRREKTFRFIPNVLIVHSIQNVEWKLTLSGRDNWYDAVQKQLSLIEK